MTQQQAIANCDIKALTQHLRSGIKLENIPAQLIDIKVWVIWKVESINPDTGKFSKVPYYVRTVRRRSGTQGSPEDRKRLVNFEQAYATFAKDASIAGMGIALLPEFNLVALDIDHSVKNSEIVDPFARTLIDTRITYAEYSPSGTGLRLIFFGKVKDSKNHKSGYELFHANGFVTITGNLAGDATLQPLDDITRGRLEQLASSSSKPKASTPLQSTQPPAVDSHNDKTLDTLLSVNDAVIQDLESAVRALKPQRAEGYDDWIKVVMALSSLKQTDYADKALELAHDFSQKCEDKYDADVLDRRWEGMDPTDLTYRTLFTLAQEDGWINPSCKGSRHPGPPSIFDTPPINGLDVRHGTASTRPLTELGNALRMIDLYGDRIRYVSDAGAWLIWQNDHWQWDIDRAKSHQLTSELHRSIYKEGASFRGSDALEFAKYAKTSQSARTILATLSILQNRSEIRHFLASVDAVPFLAGFSHARQVIDLKTGEARPASKADYITKSLRPDTLGDPNEAVKWKAFLNQIFESNTELIDWLQRYCGYLLTGSTQEQFFIFCYGFGANGKSVFAETLRHVMGDYVRAIAPETLTEAKRQAGNASPDLADLIGSRMVLSSETEEGATMAESLVKSLIAGDSMTARKLYGNPIQFIPEFKLLMLGNHKPRINGTDYGIWRRIRLIPFTRVFKEDERNPNLLNELKDEAPHILAWMVQGCLAWQQKGLNDTPAVVAAQTAAYQADEDVIGQWMEECLDLDTQATTPASALYGNYQSWAEDNGYRPMSQKRLANRLSERGYQNGRTRDKRHWIGLKIKSTGDDSEFPNILEHQSVTDVTDRGRLQ